MQTDTAIAERAPANAHPRVLVTHEKYPTEKPTRITYSYVTEGKTVKYGVAFCAPADQFSRSLGRKIAQGRLKTHPVIVENVDTSKGELINQAIRASLLSHLPHNWFGARFVSRED